jgi:diketogulonate reductase-like aldo/keto reductase
MQKKVIEFMALSLEIRLKLNNKIGIPMLGFGTWELEGNAAYKPVKWALEEGYRLIDTAAVYNNEEFVGRAIAESDMSREDLFITSKVWNSDQGYDNTLKAYDNSLDKLGVEYLDLYLMHWPIGMNEETWSALETIYKEGRVKAIGVSNFTVNDIKGLLDARRLTPAVNQILMHPLKYKSNKDVVEYCQENNINVEAYSPLIHGYKLDKEIFREIARRYHKSVPQVLIRWSLQRGFICIPRSSKREHIRENAEVFDFELSESDMMALNSL